MSEIVTVKGNITDCPEGINVISHGCNTHNIMGAGVAKALRNKWPETYEADIRAYNRNLSFNQGNHEKTQQNLLGHFSTTDELDNFKGGKVRIMNLYCQRLGINSLAGCPTDYNAVISAFRAAIVFLTLNYKTQITVGIPYGMGCGLAGGSWDIYESIIKDAFKKTNMEVILVKFQ